MTFLSNNRQEKNIYMQDPLNALMCYPTWRNLKRGHLSLSDQKCNFSEQWICDPGNFRPHFRTRRIYVLAGQTFIVVLKSYQVDISQSSPYVSGIRPASCFPAVNLSLQLTKEAAQGCRNEVPPRVTFVVCLFMLMTWAVPKTVMGWSPRSQHSSICAAPLVSRSLEQHRLWSLFHSQLQPPYTVSPRSLQLREGAMPAAVGIDWLLMQGDSCIVSSWQCCYLTSSGAGTVTQPHS